MIALRGMLRAGHFTSSHDFSFGGHAVDFGWRPKTGPDFHDWYGGALAIAKRLALSDSPHRASARHFIAERFREIWCFGYVFDQLEETAVAIGKQEYWPEGWLAVQTTTALDAKRMEEGLAARLRTLQERLGPRAFDERVRSFVLTPAFKFAQLAHWESGEEHGKTIEAIVDEARQLGRIAGEDLALLDGLWLDLFGPNASQAQAISFGEGLAEAAVRAKPR
jgi:hypothetical protein